MAKRDIMSKYNKHYKGIISKEVKDYATNYVLSDSKYIFVTREDGKKMGYCTHCRKTFVMPSYKHNESMDCPKCKSSCKVKDTRYKHTQLCDAGQFYTFRQSKVDSNIIVGTFCYTERDYRYNYKDVKTYIREQGRYYFEVGNAKLFQHTAPWGWYSHWYQRQSITPLDNLSEFKNPISWFDHRSLEKAIVGTPFEHVYDNTNGYEYVISLFRLFCKYPFIEYLLKGPFNNLIKNYVSGCYTHRTLNWRAKTPHGFFRLSKQCYKKVKNEHIDFGKLHTIQLMEKYSHKWTMEQINIIDDTLIGRGYGHKAFTPEMLFDILSAEQICNYIYKQMQKTAWCHNGQGMRPLYSTDYGMASDWLDYLDECKMLDYDLSDSQINRPNSLDTAHMRTSSIIKHTKNELLDKKCMQRYEELCKRYSYSNNKFLIRPAASMTEIIDEGKVLKHCVGGYAEKHAKGLTTILFVRKKSEPDVPFYTMEVSNYDKKRGSFTQCRGLKNKGYTGIKGLEKFLDTFAKEKIKKSNKSKEQKAI